MLAQFYPPVIGGEERHVRNLAVGLAARGHDVHVGTLRLGGDGFATPVGDAVDDPGVTIHHLDHLGRRLPRLYPEADRPLALPVPDPLTTRGLARLVSELGPDVVHSHNWILSSYLPLSAAKHLPLVHSLHDYSHVCATKRLVLKGEPCPGPAPSRCLPCADEHYGRGRGALVYAAVQAGRPARRSRVDVFTPVSRYVAAANLLEESGATWRLVPNFVPDALVSARPERDPALPADPFLFFAGDLSRQKGVHTLLAAYDRLPAATRPPLLLVGAPAEELRLPAGAEVAHRWPHERVVSAFAHCLAAALPSEWPDPCPTTVLEAMALGAPLVTTHRGGIADMTTDEVSALVVPPGDAVALAGALARLVDDAALRERLVTGARAQVRGFLQSTVVTDLEKIYAGLVVGHGDGLG